MCGIYGVIGSNVDPEWRRNVMIRLAEETEIRGKDSTGIALIDGEGSLRVSKEPSRAAEFVREKSFLELVGEPSNVIIGHNRAKTVGDESNNQNNHPITSKRTGITVIHNGGISNHSAWRNTLDDGFNFMIDDFDAEVDSEAIIRMIDTCLHLPRGEDNKIDPLLAYRTPKGDWKRSIDLMTAIDEAVYNLKGGQSCALLDPLEPNTVYLWRTTNPMVMAFIEEYEALVFASTKEILFKALEVKNYESHYNFFHVANTDETPQYIWREVPTNRLYRITVNPDADLGNRFVFDEAELEPGKGWEKNDAFDEEEAKELLNIPAENTTEAQLVN